MIMTLKTGTVVHYDARGLIHRDDGPAAIAVDGSEIWVQHGQVHRADGPAVRLVTGSVVRLEYWLHGKCLEIDDPLMPEIT